MSDTLDEDPQARIVRARADLAEKLGELRRREEKVRDSIAPVRHLQHLASPWVRIGLAALAGLALGRTTRTTSTAMVKYREPSVLDAVAKIATIAASAMVLYRAAVDSRRGSVEDDRKRRDD